MNIDKMVEIGLLFEQYKELLTDKQKEIVSLYYGLHHMPQSRHMRFRFLRPFLLKSFRLPAFRPLHIRKSWNKSSYCSIASNSLSSFS